MKYIGYVYKFYCNITSKNYIGITTKEDVNDRWEEHKREAFNKNRPNNHFHNAIVKYGYDEFEKSILLKLESDNKETLIDSLKQLEKFYIEKFDSYRNGYNSTVGGDGIIGDVCCKKVLVFNELGEYLNTCNSRVEASSLYNVPATGISDCCNRVIYTSGWKDGLRLVFRNEGDIVNQEDLDNIRKAQKNQKIQVKAYDYYTGEYLKTYNSIIEASNDTGINVDSISKCAKKKIIKTGINNQSKLVWRYINDNYIPNYKIEAFVNNQSIGKFVDQQIASKTLNVDQTTISDCLNGKYKSAGKYNGNKIVWKKI